MNVWGITVDQAREAMQAKTTLVHRLSDGRKGKGIITALYQSGRVRFKPHNSVAVHETTVDRLRFTSTYKEETQMPPDHAPRKASSVLAQNGSAPALPSLSEEEIALAQRMSGIMSRIAAMKERREKFSEALVQAERDVADARKMLDDAETARKMLAEQVAQLDSTLAKCGVMVGAV